MLDDPWGFCSVARLVVFLVLSLSSMLHRRLPDMHSSANGRYIRPALLYSEEPQACQAVVAVVRTKTNLVFGHFVMPRQPPSYTNFHFCLGQQQQLPSILKRSLSTWDGYIRIALDQRSSVRLPELCNPLHAGIHSHHLLLGTLVRAAFSRERVPYIGFVGSASVTVCWPSDSPRRPLASYRALPATSPHQAACFAIRRYLLRSHYPLRAPVTSLFSVGL